MKQMTLVSLEDGQIRPCSQSVTWNYRNLGAGHHYCGFSLSSLRKTNRAGAICIVHVSLGVGVVLRGAKKKKKGERGPLKENISYVFSE